MSTLWHMTLSASVLIALTALLRAAWLDRLPKGLFTALWLVAAARMVLPVSFALPMPAPVARAVEAAAAVPTEPAGGGGFPWLTALWLAGAAVAFALVAGRHLACLARYREALPVTDEAVLAVVRSFGLRRQVTVAVCQTVSAPVTYGLFRPVILLPKDWERSDGRTLAHILTHELIHIRQLHVPYKYLLTAAVCLHWFNPLAWVMYELAGRDLELSCDEAVLRRMADGRAEYAMTLISLEERRMPDPLLSGFGGRAVRERVRQIMLYRQRGLRGSLIGAAILLVSLTVFATAAAAAPAYEASDVIPTPDPVLFVSEDSVPTNDSYPSYFIPVSPTPDPIPWEPAS